MKIINQSPFFDFGALGDIQKNAVTDISRKTKIERMWVNQPSPLQIHHCLHGTHVLAVLGGECRENLARIYFLGGNIINQQIDVSSLSRGWP